ncbi:diguanylate cyclase domain-containing protein [Imhoffiella purpurea]|uniref:ATP-binding region, ATPase domain protein n=1 Tax=Imhoffiella purpurea TaxID=1249627 RepID=W9V386_9GAMM|nr:diguanylate cyclase [Imhoffiella purpurea]EXJ13963.1 ATP-binding region, ATPase domain protein [Imhoffiella purpurea]
MGLAIDPYSILAPFPIFAIGVSHGAQNRKREGETVTMDVLFESDRTLVSRIATPTGSVVRKEMRGPGWSARRRHERSILHRLADVEGVPRLIDATDDPNAILLEDSGGLALAEFARSRSMDIEDLLPFIEDLTEILASIHRQGVIHKDISPGNILMVRASGRPVIIDFDLATTFALEHPAFTHVNDIVGTLPYLAPEQTGRTGWTVDQRADLYALGATLYELATGEPPFGDGDLLQMVHDHLTRVPIPVSERNPQMPETLSRIIARLLEKEPDRRYQSAEGVRQDLHRLRLALAGGGDPDFALGERDFPWRLTPPSHLVGREAEIESLRTALDEAIQGRCRALLVSGSPGVGKTALIDELRPMVTAAGGWLVSGKSDQLRRDTTSDPLNQALRGLSRLLLAEPEEELRELEPRLLEALGTNAGLLTAVVPELATLLGVATEADEDPVRALVRLQRATLGLLRALARADRPLVLFLDDLQWAGSLLLGTMDAVIADQDACGILLVGSFRDTEVDATHPLSAMLQRWQDLTDAPRRLRLNNLPTADLEALLAGMLRIAKPLAEGLAAAIHPHTEGNPLDTVEFVNALRREGVLVPADEGWTWGVAAIHQHMGLGDVVTLLTQRLRGLPDPTQEILRLTACLGGEVELTLLQVALSVGPTETEAAAAQVEAALAPALEDGLLIMEQRGTGSVRFRHDRIQQAAYGAMSVPDRQARHLALARRFADLPAFRVVAAEQYMAALELLTDPAERTRAVFLLSQSADHARRLSNHGLTERYLATAIDLIDGADGSPESRDRLRLELRVKRHSALVGLGRFEELDRLYAVIEEDGDDPLLQAEAASAQIASLMNRGDPASATGLGLAQLARLGHPAPADDALFPAVHQGLDDLTDWASTGSADQDIERGENRDPWVKAVAKIIEKLVPPAFFAGSPVMPWLVISAARLWVSGGPLPELVTPLAHANFATVAVRGDYRTGFATVRRALAVGEALGYEPQTSTARVLYGVSAAHWLEPMEDSLRELRCGVEGLVRGGEFMYSGLSFLGSIPAVMELASTLEELLAELDAGEAFTTRTGNSYVGTFVLLFRQTVRKLRGETDAPGGSSDDVLDAALQALTENGPTPLAYDHLIRAWLAAIFGDKEALIEHAAATHALVAFYETSIASLLCRLLQGLSFAMQAAEAAPEARADLLAEFDRYRGWMAARTAEAPANFAHLLVLLDAERAAATGEVETAIRAYDRALQEVEHRQRSWHQALIAERCGRFHLAHDIEHAGRAALREARRLYQTWGATAKVERMEREFPFLTAQTTELAVQGRGHSLHSTRASTSDLSGHRIDLLAVLRASQALSSETSLARLRERVADLLCGLTGATSALLVLRDPDQEDWYLPHQDGQERRWLTHPDGTEVVPLSVLRYVERTREPLLIDDATRDDRFAHDPYVRALDKCALLVMPLRTRDQMSAMLLLENRQSRAMFGINRLDTVRLIAGQLSVSLDNARLYASLERTVAERTQALQEANAKLERLAVTDALTGLPNRRRLEEALGAEWRQALRTDAPIAIAMIDIDEFKQYNDHYGHPKGDACLQMIATVMQKNIRESDVLARYGGEEFALVMPDTDISVARQIAARIRTEVAALAEPHAKARHGIVTVSLGLASEVPTARVSAEQLLKAADEALYEAKRAGRNRVVTALAPIG